MSGPRIGTELERYYARLHKIGRDARADWEGDESFIAIAMARWPDDLEGAAHGRETNRSRMRLRHEGYVCLTRAKEEIEALKSAADQALQAWEKKVR